MKYVVPFCLLIVLPLCIGCNGNIPVKGKVTFSDDQSPLTDGMVCFETDAFQARGQLQKDGTYRLGSLKEADGVPPGTYRVFIMGAVVEDPTAKGLNAPPLPLITEKFETGSNSGITVEINAKTRKFDFSVDRHPGTAQKLKK